MFNIISFNRIVQISAGYAHSTVLSDRGQVLVFGCGLFGQIGNGENRKSVRPRPVTALPEPARLVTAGYFHNVAVSRTDRVYVWGSNPQILRLEAQQRKKDRIAQRLEQKKRQEEELENMKNLQKLEEASLSRLEKNEDDMGQVLEDLKNFNNNSDTPILEISCPTPPAKEATLDAAPPPPSPSTAKSASPPPSPSIPSLSSSQYQKEPSEDLHLSPQEVNRENVAGKILSVHCGSQHSAILTKNGR